jgi:HK97 family phage major capsid protein
MKLTAQQYRQRAAEAHAKAKAINDRASAEGRDLTAEEQAEFDAAITAGKEAAQSARQTESRAAALVGLMDAGRGDVVLAGPAPSGVQVGADLATTKPFQSFGEYMIAVAKAGTPGGVVDPRLLPLQAGPSGLSTGVPSEGGFLVQKDYSTMLLDRGREESILYPYCTKVPVGEAADGVEAPYIDETSRATGSRWGGVQVYRRGEAETVTSKLPKFGKWTLDLEDLMGLAYATERSLRDAAQLEAILTNAFASEFGFTLDDEIVRGNGVGQCLGILNSAALVTQAAEGAQTAATVNDKNVAKMYSRMPGRLKGGAIWLYNSEVYPQFPQLTTANQPMFLPPGGLRDAPGGLLLGKPLVELEQCSALGTVGDLLFANLGEYVLVEKGGVEGDSSIHVRFIYNERTFRWVWRINGQPKQKTAPTAYKGSNTQSPFVALAAR